MAAVSISNERDQRTLDQRAERLAARPSADVKPARVPDPLLIFRLRAERFCLRMNAVSGVTPLTNLILVPGAHPSIRGVMAIKGEIHTIFDLGRVLALPAPEGADQTTDRAEYVMTLRLAGVRFAVAVDQVEAIDHADLTTEAATSHDFAAGRRLVTLPSGRDLILIEDFERLLAPFIQGVAP